MKKFNSQELILMAFTFAICVLLITIGGGMIVGGKTTADNTAIRSAFIDLIQYITGGIFGAMVAKKTNDL